MASTFSNTLKSIPSAVANATSDLLASSDFVNRTIGMSNSYNDIMFIVQSLGREPVSLLGKDYMFIFDHVRRNYKNGTSVMNEMFTDCPKFTFYKEKPTVRFADVESDILTYHGNWIPDMTFASSMDSSTERFYAESQKDGQVENRSVMMNSANVGAANGQNVSSFDSLSSCDIVKKTNDLFNAGRISTLISRFHTGNDDATSKDNTTQTANSRFGLSHGRNLLKVTPDAPNGYENPYCRVWTYHHQYHTMEDAIRPFGNRGWGVGVHQELEAAEGGEVSFRTRKIGEGESAFYGGSEALDRYGVLNANGFVNIAPTAKIRNYFDGKQDDEDLRTVSPKRCMFSIENLAWKETKHLGQKEYDPNGLSAEQRGPFGGRIMWFPPYNLKFNEDVSVNWNGNEFIGRGEKLYTYTNTERRGTLSFTLLIDHPSVIDYWNRNDNGQGGELETGNGGGVDNVNNEENTLLRFFAGCDILKASPQKYQERVAKPKDPSAVDENANNGNGPKNDEDLPINDSPNSDSNVQYDKAIVCVLYYPNNYSGKDDAPNGGGVVNAVDYLMNGIGTQKYVNENNDAVDFEVSKKWRVGVDVNESGTYSTSLGGYEMIKSPVGISVATAPLMQDHEVIKKTYADLTTNERKAQYLTDEAGNIIKAKYANNEEGKKLAKQIGSNALPLNAAYGVNIDKAPYEWYRRRWYYRVDKDTENQALMRQESYMDRVSHGLNSSNGYKDIEGYKEIVNSFGIDDANKMELVSFADMYVALEDSRYIDNMLAGFYDSISVNKIRDIKKNKDQYKIVDIKFYGHASSQGNNPSQSVNDARNNSLAKNRAMTLKKWLDSKNFIDSSSASIGFINGVQSGGNPSDVDNEVTKMWRSASVVIKYAKADVDNAQSIDDREMEVIKADDQSSSDILANKVNVVSQTPSIVNGDLRDIRIDPITMKKMPSGKREAERIHDSAIRDMFSGLDGRRDDISVESDAVNTESDTVIEKTVNRYDNEGEFFKLLEKKDPFLHHLVTDKVKYFDPAFHSVSPEGFNARLTFLHQCTRQGSTVGASDVNRGNAYNLAFGRPPVCILRIGDFYYTKIVINGLSIQYDQPQWDLNPEGIGVMPMFADVNMQFAFIGGSDLSGPIARLQNAVSFNYYANASVYDDRAERVKYDDKGREVGFKPYIYPDTER